MTAKKQTQLELQRLSYLPAHSELLDCRRENFHGVYLKDICFGWTQEAADVGVGRWRHFLFCFFFKSQFSSGQLNAAKRCKNSISYFINFRQTPDSGWRACLPRACTSNGAGSGGNGAGVTGSSANSDYDLSPTANQRKRWAWRPAPSSPSVDSALN